MSIFKIGNKNYNEVIVNIGSTNLINTVISDKLILPSGISFPNNAYFLAPDNNGNFTKAMVEAAIANGEEYIVFDADTLDVHYEESPDLVDNNTWLVYLNLSNIQGTEQNPITFDFRKVYINCYPSAVDSTASHRFIWLNSCENLIFKFGRVEGDKYKRTLEVDGVPVNSETQLENTTLIKINSGNYNIVVDGGNTSAFMADILHSGALGKAAIDNSPLSLDYYLQSDGRYESRFYDIDPTVYATFGLTGGLGYNRLLYYDMEDITFKFYDINENFISEITGAQYYDRYSFPITARKMKVNINPMDGRIESPTNFGHRLEYEPNNTINIKNMHISDNHRGGLANVGADTTVENVTFFNTQRYFDAPKFGVNGITYSTTYHINCEDVVSRNLTIRNSVFRDKFHKILLTHNINANITNNTFEGSGNNIFIYDLLYGNITENNFISTGTVSGGEGTNKSLVTISNNTGAPNIILTNGAEWKNNNFTNADLNGKGKCNNNTFTNTSYAYLDWTKEITENIFTGNGESVPYTNVGSYIYKNNFVNTYFTISHGTHLSNAIIYDTITFDNTAQPSIHALERSGASPTVIVVNSIFKGGKIKDVNVNKAVDFVQGTWYFENCIFQDIVDHIILIGTNYTNTDPIKFYFKDCTFIGSGNLINTFYSGAAHNIVFDNCIIDANITLNGTNSTGTVTIPALIEPRTHPIPIITRNTTEGRTEIATNFHIMSLQIRNKNTLSVILNKDVCSTYLHYNTTPNDFEYSIDGGVYWDEINN